MGKIAFLFAGQGAQYPGMGKSLYDISPAAKQIFDQADQLRPGTISQCFEGPEAVLLQTANTQPCLFTMDLACAKAAQVMGIQPDMCAGFSLGEVAAAAFCGLYSFDTAFAFVKRRGELMQACAEAVPGCMTAVLRLTTEQVLALCNRFLKVYPVNFNCPGQIVVSGPMAEMEAFEQAVIAEKGRAVRLKVSGGFHSPMMAPAARELAAWLENVSMSSPAIPLYANKTALPYGENAPFLLSSQVESPVLWEDTILNMLRDGATTFVEVGPGAVLTGLVRKIAPNVAVCHVEDEKSLESAVSMFEGGATQC